MHILEILGEAAVQKSCLTLQRYPLIVKSSPGIELGLIFLLELLQSYRCEAIQCSEGTVFRALLGRANTVVIRKFSLLSPVALRSHSFEAVPLAIVATICHAEKAFIELCIVRFDQFSIC